MTTLKQILEEYAIKKGKPELLKSEIIQCAKKWLQQKHQKIENEKSKWIYYRKFGNAIQQFVKELLEELK